MLITAPPYRLAARRAEYLLQQLDRQLRSGDVSTQSDLLRQAAFSVIQFLESIQSPALQVPYMRKDDLLCTDLVTVPIQQADADIHRAGEQVEFLRQFTRQIFNLSQARRTGLSQALKTITSLVNAYRLWTSDSDTAFLWSSDTFSDRSHVSTESTAWVDLQGGVVTLFPEGARSLSERIVSATIDSDLSAGGIPGNNLEIYQPGSPGGTGDTEGHPVPYDTILPFVSSLKSVWDGNPDTWFEWERNYVPLLQPTLKVGKCSRAYDPAGKPDRKIPEMGNWNCYIQWPGVDGVDTGVARKGYPLAYFQESDQKDLCLALSLKLDTPTRVSWLQITPLIKAATYPQVDQIMVSVDGKQWRSLLTVPTVLHPRMNHGVDYRDIGAAGQAFDGIGVWQFPETPVQYIKIVLRQTQRYQMPLGAAHRFYHKGKNRKNQKAARIVGSRASLLGDPDTVLVPSDAGEFSEAYDVYKGYRQVIALRDVLLEERVYSESGQVISTPIKPASPVKAVALITTESIPDDWPSTNPDGDPWISYEVSADGTTWYPIVPQRTELENSVAEFDTPATSLVLRATLTRPTDRPSETPMLHAYALKMVPS